VSFSVLFVCICVLYYCHRVAIQLQLNISHIISYHFISYHIIYYISYIISYYISYHIIYHIISHILHISYGISYHIIYHVIYHISHIYHIYHISSKKYAASHVLLINIDNGDIWFKHFTQFWHKQFDHERCRAPDRFTHAYIHTYIIILYLIARDVQVHCEANPPPFQAAVLTVCTGL
jgi:hypothetical protein